MELTAATTITAACLIARGAHPACPELRAFRTACPHGLRVGDTEQERQVQARQLAPLFTLWVVSRTLPLHAVHAYRAAYIRASLRTPGGAIRGDLRVLLTRLYLDAVHCEGLLP
jgi:hypothetical protein